MLMLVGVGGLVLAYAGKKLLARQEVVEGPKVELMPVAVADLNPGTVITSAHIGMARIRLDRLDPASARTEKVLLGRVVKNALKRAEPINMVDLYAPGEFPPLNVEKGMRAVSINLNDNGTVSGLQVGQYVDVHFSPTAIIDPEKGAFTMTLFKGVKVLELGGSGSRNNAKVTLELTPEQSNILILAKDKGDLQLTYTPEGKGAGGVAVKDADRATLSEILGLTPPKKEPEPFVTEIYSGTGRRVQSFKDGKRADQYGVQPYNYNRAPASASSGIGPVAIGGDAFGGNNGGGFIQGGTTSAINNGASAGGNGGGNAVQNAAEASGNPAAGGAGQSGGSAGGFTAFGNNGEGL
jgi:pilus assembly protein CpaB